MQKPLLLVPLLALGLFAGAQPSAKTKTTHSAAVAPAKNFAPPGTVIVPASSFVDRLPKNDIIAEARGDGWYFNNTAMVLNSLTNLITWVNVPESGKYYIYARSSGAKNQGFKVVVNDKVTAERFGDTALTWKRAAPLEVKAGRAVVKITRINPGSTVDVVVLSKTPNLKEEDIKPYQLNPDVELLKEYHSPLFPGLPKFGDVDGDKKTDFLVLSPDFTATMFDNSGKQLWQYKAPEENAKLRSEFEAPGVLWDFDHDGKAEVVHWRLIDGKEWLVIANGMTGDIIRKVEWPTQPLPHVYNNFRLAIAKLTKGAPNEIAVFTDMGGTINTTLYDSNLKLLWQHTEKRQKDNQGHYIYPLDIDGDGIDEILVGSELLDAKGKEIWNRFDLVNDNHDHADSYKLIDMDHDGKLDIVISNSETGVYAIKGMTKEIIWQNVAEHSQQLDVGDFLKGVPGPQTVIGGRTYGNRNAGEPYLGSQLYWFDNQGNLVNMWPHGFPINGNPNFVSGNWKGDGKRQVFWYKWKLNDKGEGELYFPDQVYHIFDFTGRGADEVITFGRGVMRVYGSRTAIHTGKDRKADLRYLQLNVANHTHY
ncbi:hypothetical protein C8P68_107160 [Mucilaginibacter yixingensis]|uniref:VCBS repeat protein n=1 Tax=Mucilaginibacter yixingensis TaxID=1295612 RepID=A0A2T5J6B9_9SPHI|nr:hypothetical protein [Mucilaginibacter yixingensis]PTQ94095.1 hypothetical protein C8P68_107160 [Mucilaginibacter yixingensis]